MTDLATWLLEQITEDQTAASSVAPLGHNYDMGGKRQDDRFSHTRIQYATTDGRAITVPGHEANHFDRWQPARVLAECDAKRRRIELHQPREKREPDGSVWHYCATCGSGEPYEYPTDWPCQTLRLEALPYAHQPGYQPQWAPNEPQRDDQPKRAYADDQQ